MLILFWNNLQPTTKFNILFLFQISELALQVAILFYGGHLVVTDQMSGGTLISFVIYELELGECLEVRHVVISLQPYVRPFSDRTCVCSCLNLFRPTEHCVRLYGSDAGRRSCREGLWVHWQEAQAQSWWPRSSRHVARLGRIQERDICLSYTAWDQRPQGIASWLT